jgi:RimJ/RimL family protein N-acetyltransferase
MLQLNFQTFPLLRSERLLFRQIKPADAPAIFFLRSDSRVMKYIDRKPEQSISEAEEHIKKINRMVEENEALSWGIALKNDPEKLIGYIGLWKFQTEHYRAEIGYVLHPDHWRKGYIKEAIRTVTQYGFNNIGLHSIEAHINPENSASAAVLEFSGFEKEAYFRENYFFQGKFLDTAVYSLLDRGVPVKPAPGS